MEKKEKKQSVLSKYFSPGFVLMSVMIGGGFATGREIVQYGGMYGARGWIIGLFIAIGFSVLAMLAFEIARLYKVYDYRSHLKIYAGPLTILFDIIFFVISLLVMSVMASATGNILEGTLGIPYYGGVSIIVIISALLAFFGKELIAKFEVWGALFLYIGYIVFAILAICGRTDNIARVFAEGDTSYITTGTFGIGALIWTGLIYVGYNIQPLTTTFFVLENQKTRKDTLISGAIAGPIIVIPWALTYLALMAYYPSEEVFGATIPWLVMMKDQGTAVVVIFCIVIGWTLIATAVGVLNAIAGRIDNQLLEHNKPILSSKQRTMITLAYLVGAVILAKIGIIDLIGKGYMVMSYGFIISFIVPLITVGLYKIITFKKTHSNTN